MLQEIEMPDEILFNFCIDMHCYTAECEKQVDNYFYCKMYIKYLITSIKII